MGNVCHIRGSTHVLWTIVLIQPFSFSQGAKAQQKRERNAAKAGATAKSQIKTNQAAMNIVCQTCKQAFVRSFFLPSPHISLPGLSTRC